MPGRENFIHIDSVSDLLEKFRILKNKDLWYNKKRHHFYSVPVSFLFRGKISENIIYQSDVVMQNSHKLFWLSPYTINIMPQLIIYKFISRIVLSKLSTFYLFSPFRVSGHALFSCYFKRLLHHSLHKYVLTLGVINYITIINSNAAVPWRHPKIEPLVYS